MTVQKLILIMLGENGKYWSDSARNIIPFIYKITTYNCQHYFAEVLQQAQKYETREKPLVLP